VHNEICEKMIKEESSLSNQKYGIMKDVHRATRAENVQVKNERIYHMSLYQEID